MRGLHNVLNREAATPNGLDDPLFPIHQERGREVRDVEMLHGQQQRIYGNGKGQGVLTTFSFNPSRVLAIIKMGISVAASPKMGYMESQASQPNSVKTTR